MKLAQACIAIAAARRVICPRAPLAATLSAMHAFDLMGEMEGRLDALPQMDRGVDPLKAPLNLPIIVVDGDGGLLRTLGSLVTGAHNGARSLVHFVCSSAAHVDKTYKHPGAESGAWRKPVCDITALALANGYRRAERFDDAQALATALPRILAQKGASCVELELAPITITITPGSGGNETPRILPSEMELMRLARAEQALKMILGDRSLVDVVSIQQRPARPRKGALRAA